MRRGLIILAMLACTSLTGFAAFRLLQVLASPPRTLASLMPTGALLEIQAKDFGSLVSDWNRSKEKPLWLGSDQYQQFARSRLFMRLDASRTEFEAAAGAPPDMAFLSAVAGTESALAIYDIGKLEFLYVTRMPSAKAADTVLWQKRGDYQTRSVGDQPYYVKVDAASQRTVAFAATPDLLLLATREDLLSGALKLIADPASASSIESEHWFSEPTKAANARGPAGDLRLVLDMKELARNPYFRSYWIQGNAHDLRAYRSADCDVFRSSDQIREERILFRAESASDATPAAKPEAPSDLDALLAWVPPDAGFYRGWAHMSPDDSATLLAAKVLAPASSAPMPGTLAPVVNLNGDEAGNSTDLETRIDQAPPPSTAGALALESLRALIEGAPPAALAEIESSGGGSDNVLPDHRAAVLIEAAREWDSGAAERAIQSAIASLWTTSGLGVHWVERTEGGITYDALDGLTPLEVATRGKILLVSDDPALAAEILHRSGAPVAAGASTYAAGLRLDRERRPFETITGFLDWNGTDAAPVAEDEAPADAARVPAFFSGAVGSLVRAAGRIDGASIMVRETANAEQQTVIYRLSAPR